MREPPFNLDNATILRSLEQRYELATSDLEFLPIGHDASAWAYRAQGRDGKQYFIKIRQTVSNPASLIVPRFLQDRGVSQVAAPLPTKSGDLASNTDSYALIVYPFLHAEPAKDCGLTNEQWSKYGNILREVHEIKPDSQLNALIKSETFEAPGVKSIERLNQAIEKIDRTDLIAVEFAEFWQAKREAIDVLVETTESLGRRFNSEAPPMLLCHADFHTANVLVDTAGDLWVVDWDEVVLAPRERDLMFVVGGGINRALVTDDNELYFLQGYGSTQINATLLGYYRRAWAVNDIGAYGEQILLRDDLGTVSRQSALESFKSLFQPGYIVSLALQSTLPTFSVGQGT